MVGWAQQPPEPPPNAGAPPGTPPGASGTPPEGAPGPPQFAGPPYKLLREDEDWGYLSNPALGRDWLDPIKYIPLGQNPRWYLTLGGEIRQWFEDFHNENWGAAPAVDNAYLLERYMLNADFHFGKRFRFFIQLKSGIENGRAGGPRPQIDEDRLDFNSAFFDINLDLNEKEQPNVTLRVGRQELHYGTGRMVSAREGPNVRQPFDGARLIFNTHGWRIDTFAVKPVITDPGVFDDAPDHTQSFWGVYGTGNLPSVPFKLDLYYLGLDRKSFFYNKGIGREQRHSIGARISKGGPVYVPGHGLDYDLEAAFQFGTFGPGVFLSFSPAGLQPIGPMGRGDIRAWTFGGDVGYSFENVRLQPRLGLTTGITSGDHNPHSPGLDTFAPPFPNGHYFGAIQQNGPFNVEGLRPNLIVRLPHRSMFTADCYFFWRESLNDGFYNIAGFLLRPAGTNLARYIGSQPQVEYMVPVSNHITVDFIYAFFQAGPYLQQSPPGQNLRYAGFFFDYKF